MAATDTFERSLGQRQEALTRANQVRALRKKLKKEMADHRRNPLRVLQSPPDFAEAMNVHKFLMAVPGIGRQKVDRLLLRCNVSPSKTLGGLSDRQRTALAHGIKEKVWLNR